MDQNKEDITTNKMMVCGVVAFGLATLSCASKKKFEFTSEEIGAFARVSLGATTGFMMCRHMRGSRGGVLSVPVVGLLSMPVVGLLSMTTSNSL